MKALNLSGSIVALVTPFRNGQVDIKTLERLVEFHIQNGTSGIVPCGTTGESPTLSHEEHRMVVEVVVAASSGRIPVIAGTGSNNTKEAIELTQAALQSGADGALLIAPYYNRPTQEGIYQHYKLVAQSVDIPIVLYNIQSRTGVNIEPETVARLSDFENIVGIKEASGNLEQMSRVISLVGNKMQLVSGDDALTLPVLSIGGVGVISVLANILPQTVADLIDLFQAGKIVEAREIHYKYLSFIKSLFIESNPSPVKYAMSRIGAIDPEIRLPLCEVCRNSKEMISSEMQKIGLL